MYLSRLLISSFFLILISCIMIMMSSMVMNDYQVHNRIHDSKYTIAMVALYFSSFSMIWAFLAFCGLNLSYIYDFWMLMTCVFAACMTFLARSVIGASTGWSETAWVTVIVLTFVFVAIELVVVLPLPENRHWLWDVVVKNEEPIVTVAQVINPNVF